MTQRDITKCQVLVTIDEIDNPVPGRSKIVQVATLDGKTELEPIVDRDLDAFGKFYTEEMGNGSFHRVERAAIKTYLAWKLSVSRKD